MGGGVQLQIARACSIAWPKMPPYMRIEGFRGQYGLCEKGVRSEWEETRNVQDVSVMHKKVERKDWWHSQLITYKFYRIQ